MPTYPSDGVGVGGAGGGGGLHFPSPIATFTFTGATLTLARTARNTYFTTTDATAYEDFANDPSLAIRLQVTGSSSYTFETYVGSADDAYANANWMERTDAIQGNPGAAGAQALYHARQYRNAATAPTTPTGGSVNVGTGVVTPSTDWTALPTVPGTGEDTYEVLAVINPATQSGECNPHLVSAV